MEDSANFIPLGSGRGAPQASKDAPRISRGLNRPPKVIGETLEERKRIAREVRLAAKKEKKKAKQEAKAARKLNGILHRRMNRNDEKYVKNKERNHKRDIDMERRAIRDGAVKQAEQLAAIHDLSGKMFNVGELVVMPDGQVKSRERLREGEETRRRRAQEAADYEAKVKKANDGFREARAKKEEELAAKGREMTVLQVQMLRAQFPVPARISKKQMARREAYAPRPPPPKPVIPEGFSIPEKEEDLLALWDITDDDIVKRINRRKKEKTQAAKSLRKIQKEKKKFNRAVKMIKKQCAAAGVLFDPEKAKKEVLGMMSDASDSDSDAGRDDGSGSDSSSDSESDGEGDEPKGANGDVRKTKAEEKAATALKLKGTRPKIDLELLAKANAFEEALKQKKRERKDKRKAERKAKAEKEAAEQAKLEEEKNALEEDKKKATKAALKAESADDSSSKKRKRSRDAGDDEDNSKKAEKKAKKAASKAEKTKVQVETEDVVESQPEEPTSSKRKRVEEPEEDEEARASREKRERKKAKKAKKAAAMDAESGSEDNEAKAKRERKEARKAEKVAKAKPTESNDDRLDKAIAEREAKLKAGTETKEDAPNVDQWNPEALDGDDARKSKFMRLLGAGKGNGDGEKKVKRSKEEKDAKKTVEQISKVQSELERQYETGMKMKHDGGSKRRGLGA